MSELRQRGSNGEAGYCAHCEQQMPEGPDICLGLLEGVEQACCGHGGQCRPYVLFSDGTHLFDDEAHTFFQTSTEGHIPFRIVEQEWFSLADRALVVTARYDLTDLLLIEVSWNNLSDQTAHLIIDNEEIHLTPGETTLDLRIRGLHLLAGADDDPASLTPPCAVGLRGW